MKIKITHIFSASALYQVTRRTRNITKAGENRQRRTKSVLYPSLTGCINSCFACIELIRIIFRAREIRPEQADFQVIISLACFQNKLTPGLIKNSQVDDGTGADEHFLIVRGQTLYGF